MFKTHTFSQLSFCILTSLALISCQAEKTLDDKLSDPERLQVASNDSAEHNIYNDYLQRDVRDDIFYFVLPDRFENGDKTNDQGSKTELVSQGGFKPNHKAYYHGGDLAGLEQRLDYLKALGITAIWMTPILRNRALQGDSSGYHGYWIVDFSQIDPHLGSNEELKSLIDKAHSMGMKVFFDIITNHTADIIRYKECHDEMGRHLDASSNNCKYKSMAQISEGDTYTPFIPSGEQNLKYPAWLNDPKYYNNQGDSEWYGESAIYGDFSGLDDLDTRQPAVVDGFIEIYKNIVSEFKPDGFRIDTVKHVDMSFWQAFSPAIMAHAHAVGIPKFHIFGEVYDGDPAFLSRFTTIGKLPAILDFAFQGNAESVFTNNASPEKLAKLFDDDDYYNDADSSADQLLTFVGNHDMGRIGLFLNNNLPQTSEAEKTQRSILIHAFMYFSRGIPVVYYGDEQGFTGDGNDQAAREDMMPSLVASYNDNNLLGTEATTADNNFDQSHPIFQALAEFSVVYKNNKALRHGVHFNRYADEHSGLYAFSRVDLDEKMEYLLVFNASTQNKSIQLPVTSESFTPIHGSHTQLQSQHGVVNLTIPALNFVIYKANQVIAPVDTPKIKLTQASIDERSDHFINLDFQLTEPSKQPIQLLKITTEYLNKAGEYQVASFDLTPPYRAKIAKDDIANGLNGKVKVTVDNLAGETQTQMFDLKSLN